MAGSKHDADCLRRKRESGQIYLCTCDMTDEQVEAARSWAKSPQGGVEAGYDRS